MKYSIKERNDIYRLSYLLTLLFLCLKTLNGQEKALDEQDTFYREDQIYFGASLMLFNSNQDDFKSQGLSRHIQFGIIRDIPLNNLENLPQVLVWV